METIVIAIVGLIITCFIIRGAVKDALSDSVEKHIKLQTHFLKHLAFKAGMDQKDIDSVILTPKEFKKKYGMQKSLEELIKE